jgi:hypothetical protein
MEAEVPKGFTTRSDPIGRQGQGSGPQGVVPGLGRGTAAIAAVAVLGAIVLAALALTVAATGGGDDRGAGAGEHVVPERVPAVRP